MTAPAVEIFCICMDANPCGKGATDIIGTFCRVNISTFPATIRKLTLFVRLRFDVSHEGIHVYEIFSADLHNKTEDSLVKGSFPVSAEPGDGHAWASLSVDIHNV